MKIDIVTLTRYFKNGADFDEWVRHHFSLGITHIHVIDSGNKFDLMSHCAQYGDKVTCKQVVNPLQYPLYNDYFSRSDADFIVPVDDDEFIWIDPRFKTLEDALSHIEKQHGKIHVLGIRWKYMFPECFHSERHCPLLDYCVREDDQLARKFSGWGNHTVKCIVRRDSFVKYVDADESIERNHVPVSSGIDGAMLCDGSIIRTQLVHRDVKDEIIRMIHCPFKGFTEWQDKTATNFSVSHRDNKKRRNRFDLFLEKLP